MAWADCPTHGPIQDARSTFEGGVVVALHCSCGLECSSYEPVGFVEHGELVELAKSNRQPRVDHVPADAPEVSEAPESDPLAAIERSGSYYTLPDGSRVQGRSKALAALDALTSPEA